MSTEFEPGSLVEFEIEGSEVDGELWKQLMGSAVAEKENLEEAGVQVQELLGMEREELQSLWSKVNAESNSLGNSYEEKHKQRITNIAEHIAYHFNSSRRDLYEITEEEFEQAIFEGREHLADQMAGIEKDLVDNYLLFFNTDEEVDRKEIWNDHNFENPDIQQARKEYQQIMAGYLFMRARTYEFEHFLQESEVVQEIMEEYDLGSYDQTVMDSVEQEVGEEHRGMQYEWELDPVYNNTPIRISESTDIVEPDKSDN